MPSGSASTCACARACACVCAGAPGCAYAQAIPPPGGCAPPSTVARFGNHALLCTLQAYLWLWAAWYRRPHLVHCTAGSVPLRVAAPSLQVLSLLSALFLATFLPSWLYRSFHLPPLESTARKRPTLLFRSNVPHATSPAALQKVPGPCATPASKLPTCELPSRSSNVPVEPGVVCGRPLTISPTYSTPGARRDTLLTVCSHGPRAGSSRRASCAGVKNLRKVLAPTDCPPPPFDADPSVLMRFLASCIAPPSDSIAALASACIAKGFESGNPVAPVRLSTRR